MRPADPAHAEGAVIAVLADGSRFVLDAVIQEDGGALRAAELSVAPLTRPPQVFISLHASQTPIRHQRDRGTCVIHAVAAAMDAQYARLGLGNLALSEQYGQHLTKMTSLFVFTTDPQHVHTRDGYENQLALGGGGNVYDRLELLEDYGLPHEALATSRMVAAGPRRVPSTPSPTRWSSTSPLTLDRDSLREGDSYASRLVTLRYPGSDLEAKHRIVPCTVSPGANTGIRNCSEQTLTGMLWNRQDEVLAAWEAREAFEKEHAGLYAS